MAKWNIGLDSWIIQDGNYGDFKCGDLASFAVEFSILDVSLSAESQKNYRHIEDSVYEITALPTLTAECWILDFGLQVFQERAAPQKLSNGEFVHATVWLGIDPFFYFESLSKSPNIPPLIYSWKIEQILIQTAPFIETEKNAFVRDKTKWKWTEINKTDAWKDDNGNAAYLLVCELLNKPPVRNLH